MRRGFAFLVGHAMYCCIVVYCIVIIVLNGRFSSDAGHSSLRGC
jgi:hypothetical protein